MAYHDLEVCLPKNLIDVFFHKVDTCKFRSHQYPHAHAYVHIMAGIKEVDMTCTYFWVAHKTPPFFFSTSTVDLSCGLLLTSIWLQLLLVAFYITRTCG